MRASAFLLVITLWLSSCLPAPRNRYPASPTIHRPLPSQYARFMWSVYDPDATLLAAPDRILANGPLGLTAYDTMSSNTAWQAPEISRPSAVRDTTLYRPVPGGLQAYDTKNGKLLWQTQPPYRSNVAGLYVNSNNIFLSEQNDRLLVLDRSGNFIAALDTSSAIEPLSVESGILYYSDSEGLHARDVKTEELRWTAAIPDIRASVITDQDIYVLAEPFAGWHAIYAVAKRNGTILWKWDRQAQVISNLCLLGSNLFFLTRDGYLVLLNTRTGNQATRIEFTNVPFVLDRAQPPVTGYQVAADPLNGALAIAFGDTYQIVALKLTGPPEVFIEKPLYR
jgi:outer membrane protein assembly factor BamB